MKNKREVRIIDLGWGLARLTTNDNSKLAMLTIASPSSADQDGYQPAESVTIAGEESLRNLQQALNEAFSTVLPTLPFSVERSRYPTSSVDNRVEIAIRTLGFYRAQRENIGVADHENITNLMSDLLHYLATKNPNPEDDFSRIASRALQHFAAEKELP